MDGNCYVFSRNNEIWGANSIIYKFSENSLSMFPKRLKCPILVFLIFWCCKKNVLLNFLGNLLNVISGFLSACSLYCLTNKWILPIINHFSLRKCRCLYQKKVGYSIWFYLYAPLFLSSDIHSKRCYTQINNR